MIRIDTSERRRNVREELTAPSPARIAQLAAAIRKHWSPAKHAQRAGQAWRVQLLLVATRDLEGQADEICR